MSNLVNLNSLKDKIVNGVALNADFMLVYPERGLNSAYFLATRTYNNDSLDAALLLHTLLLPEYSWSVSSNNRVGIWNKSYMLLDAVSETPAKAWLLAIIKVCIKLETRILEDAV